MFDKNVVTSVTNLEHVLDYTFSHLGLSGESSIDYPLLLTEALCSPNYVRSNVSELLFECYDIPGVCYGVDALMSFFFNYSKSHKVSIWDASKSANGVILSSSHQTTHLIPIVNGETEIGYTKRLGIGGYNTRDLL
jgi:actin-related protein 5